VGSPASHSGARRDVGCQPACPRDRAARAVGARADRRGHPHRRLNARLLGFSPSTWTPVHGWAASGGTYSISVHGDRFVVVETDKVGSLDELRQLLQAGEPSCCLYRTCTSMPPTAAIQGLTGPSAILPSIVIPVAALPRPVQGDLLVLGLASCCVAVEGGGPIVRSSGKLPGVEAICRAGTLRSAHVADRDGPVCCWWPAPLASAS
jgi:hypothetical protein